MRKRTMVYILLLAPLVSCGGKGESSSKAAQPRAAKTVLTVLAGQSTSDAGIEEMINEAVAKGLGDVELEWERVDWGEQFQSQMQAKIAAGDVSDIMIGKTQDVATYAPSGLLAPLSPGLAARVNGSALAAVSRHGNIYGLPYNAFYQGVFYDKALFARYRLEPPRTERELADLVAFFKSKGLVPFATHFAEGWYLGNILMQFALGEVFPSVPDWGDRFRAGETSFAASPSFRRCFEKAAFVYRNSWADAAAVTRNECDERFSNGEAAMYLSGSWILQSLEAMNPGADIGIFPYPNGTGDAKLIYEPNMTFMKSAVGEHGEAVDRVLDLIFSDDELAYEIFEFTKTSSLLQGRGPEVPPRIQGDVDAYAARGLSIDATIGNTQLIWSFQQELATRLLEWLRGTTSLDSVIRYADEHRFLSAP